MNKVVAAPLASASRKVSRRHFSCYSFLIVGAILLTHLVSPAFGQTEVQNLTVVINALTQPDLGITASLSLINLEESNERRAVDNEILHFSSEKQLFIQGSWQNPGLLVYDIAARDWIRDKDDTIANFSNDADTPVSGGLTFAPDGNLYITQPDWSGGGQDFVHVMDVADASLLRTYHVGPAGSILGFARIIPRREDINNDGFVNMKDMIIAGRFLGDEGAGILADVNGDKVVNILDLVLIGHGL